MKDFNIGGIAHITGGGITDNLPRIIPKGYKAVVHSGTWEIPPVFSFLKDMGSIPEDEMLRTFNNGIGMILIVRTKESKEILDRLHSLGQKAFVIGEMEKAEREQEAIEFI
jgi:phosphoribosylformylglycinamidine cyclo-ligase